MVQLWICWLIYLLIDATGLCGAQGARTMTTTISPVESSAVPAVACSTTPVPGGGSKFWRELRALAVGLSVVVGILPLIALAWLVMWTAQVRLTPNPEAELMAELASRGPAG